MKIKNYTEFVNESEKEKDVESQYDVIESRFYYSSYCPVWFTGTEEACYRFIANAKHSNPTIELELRLKK